MEIDKSLPVHYRYDDYADEDGVKIKVRTFYPIRETRCFYMVLSKSEFRLAKLIPGRKSRVRRVSKDSMRRFCYPTKKEALNSFKKRKQHQIWHNNYALARAEQSLKALEDVESEFDSIDAGRPDYWDEVNFDC